MRLVIDTNVLVSALLTPGRTAARLLGYMATGGLTPIVDDRVLAEYADVLARPKLSIAPAAAREMLAVIGTAGTHVLSAEVHLPFAIPDPKDLPFAELAVRAHADGLVTGNDRHFADMRARGPVPVWTPAEALAEVAKARGQGGS